MRTISKEQMLDICPEAEAKDEYTMVDVLRQHTTVSEALEAAYAIDELHDPLVLGEFACRCAEHVLPFIEYLVPGENIFRVALAYQRQILFKGKNPAASAWVHERLHELTQDYDWSALQLAAVYCVQWASRGNWLEAASTAQKVFELTNGLLDHEAEGVWQIKTLIHLLERNN